MNEPANPPAAPAYVAGCNRCGLTSLPPEADADWRCRDCGMSMENFSKQLASMDPATILRGPTWVTAPWAMDRVAWSLVAANGITLAAALALNWDPASLIFIYWCQSMLIGAASVMRILTDSRLIDPAAVYWQISAPKFSTRLQSAVLFAVIFGFFNCLMLIIALAFTRKAPVIDTLFWVCLACFAAQQILSYHDARRSELASWHPIYKLTMPPGFRMVPIWAAIMLCDQADLSSGKGMIVFVAAKTLIDLLAHGYTRLRLMDADGQPVK
jgi:hypothetical protein